MIDAVLGDRIKKRVSYLLARAASLQALPHLPSSIHSHEILMSAGKSPTVPSDA